MATAKRGGLLKYRKKATHPVVAVQLDLSNVDFSYFKWGAAQQAKAGDWLVDNDGDVYTVDARSFARTYRRIGAGRYLKTTPVWARIATEAGRISTREGSSGYRRGDYLVSNTRNGSDSWSVSRGKFLAMYRRVR